MIVQNKIKTNIKTIILISCVSKKLDKEAKAEDLYISPLFKKNLAYAKSLSPTKIYILSAKHGLLDLSTTITPYDKTLNNMSSKKRKMWSEKVINQLKKVSDLQGDKFIFLAGEKYRKYIIPELNKKNVFIPMEGFNIGKQLQWLTNKI